MAEKIARYIPQQLKKAQENSMDFKSNEEKNDEDPLEREVERLLRLFHVPLLYRKASLLDFDEETRGDLKALTNSKFGAVLFGGVGSGKSHAAAALLANAVEKSVVEKRMLDEKSARWVLMPELYMELRDGYNDNRRERDVLKPALDPHVVVLDDVGLEKQTNWSTSKLYLIVTKRLESYKETIITTNLDLEDFDRWEPRIASRLAMMAHFNMGDKDERLPKKR